jgi:peptide/nickel transport system substrate-binding protein
MGKAKKIMCLVLCLVICTCVFSACAPGTDSGTAAGGSDAVSPAAGSSAAGTAGDAGSQPADANAKYAKALTVIIDNNKIVDINPLTTSAATSSTTWELHMVYDTLVALTPDGKYSPSLATSWDTTDWKTITMHLRDDVTFHNGEKFKASDVVFTVKSAQNATGTPAQDRWSSVETATAVDDYTVQFVLKNVNTFFLYNLSQSASVILNEKAVTSDKEKGTWIGTGAFKVSEFASNDHVTLQRNDSYWGEKPKTEQITLKFIPEMSTRMMMLQNGEADVCFSLSPTDLPLVEADKEHYVTYSYVSNNPGILGFNMNDPLCGDLNFRKAVACVLNRNDMVLAASNGYAVAETTGAFWGSNEEYKNESIPIMPNDLEQAKKYLSASSYQGQTVEIATAISTMISASQVIQEELSQIGIKAEIKQMDIPGLVAYTQYANNKCQMYCFVAAFNYSAYSGRSILYPGGSANRSSYNNADIKNAFDLAPTLTDPDKLKDLWYGVQQQNADDLAYISLFYPRQVASCAKGVDGMALSPDAYHDLRYIYKVVD